MVIHPNLLFCLEVRDKKPVSVLTLKGFSKLQREKRMLVILLQKHLLLLNSEFEGSYKKRLYHSFN